MGVLRPTELLHVHRLRSFISAVQVGTPHIWALLHADQQWLQHAREGLQWVLDQTSMSVTGDPTSPDLCAFTQLVEDSPQKARRLLRKAQSAALNMRIRECTAKHWHQQLAQQLTQVGYIYPADTVLVEDSQDEQEGFLCAQCGKFFDTPHGAATHAMRAHGIHALTLPVGQSLFLCMLHAGVPHQEETSSPFSTWRHSMPCSTQAPLPEP